MGSGSALEALRDDALYKCTLLFTLTLHNYSQNPSLTATQQSHIVHKKNHGVGFDVASIFLLRVMTSPGLKENVLTSDGCCWHAQCHRTKNLMTRFMFCPSARGTRCAAYRRLCHALIELQFHRVTRSRHHVGRSRST